MIRIARWVARIWSLGSIGLLGAFLIGEGMPPITLQSIVFPFGVMAGLILAWWFKRIGGIIAIASIILFYALEYAASGKFPGGYAFILISAPSVIFVLCGFIKAIDKKKNIS